MLFNLLPVEQTIGFCLFYWYCGWSLQSGDEEARWISRLILFEEVLKNFKESSDTTNWNSVVYVNVLSDPSFSFLT